MFCTSLPSVSVFFLVSISMLMACGGDDDDDGAARGGAGGTVTAGRGGTATAGNAGSGGVAAAGTGSAGAPDGSSGAGRDAVLYADCVNLCDLGLACETAGEGGAAGSSGGGFAGAAGTGASEAGAAGAGEAGAASAGEADARSDNGDAASAIMYETCLGDCAFFADNYRNDPCASEIAAFYACIGDLEPEAIECIDGSVRWDLYCQAELAVALECQP